MNNSQLRIFLEQYNLDNSLESQEFKVVRIPDRKSVFIEQSGESGRAVMMTEYRLVGATYLAGYSTYSQTLYISKVA